MTAATSRTPITTMLSLCTRDMRATVCQCLLMLAQYDQAANKVSWRGTNARDNVLCQDVDKQDGPDSPCHRTCKEAEEHVDTDL